MNREPSRMGRLPAVGIGMIAAAAAVEAMTFRTFFPADPLGPRAFTVLGAALFALGAIALWRARDDVVGWPGGSPRARIVGAVAVLGAYGTLIDSLGFVLSTAGAFAGLAWLFGARRWTGALVGVVFALGLWVGFVHGLGLPLPLGTLFS